MPNQRQLVAAGLATWFVATALSQHPDDSYARIRRWVDFTGGFAIPNWKFFAPNPGVNDYILMYRTGNPNTEDWSDWDRIIPAVKPSLRETLFSPNSRLDKGILDIVHSLQVVAGDALYKDQFVAGKKLLRDVVKRYLRCRSNDTHFQTMLIRGFGYQLDAPPIYDMVFEPEEIR